MQTQTKRKEKGICDIVGCENEATVRGQTLRFCYEHYSKITNNEGAIVETEEFFVGSHKLTKAPEYPVRLKLEGTLLKRFKVIKKFYGFEDNNSVIPVLLYEKYKQLFPKETAFFEQFSEKANLEKLGCRSMKEQVKDAKKQKVTAKRVDVPMDVDLIAEAKKHNVNIEEAAMQHFEELQKQYPEKKA
jgi:hypothetical protein